jgi:hypothetical protein
MPQNILKFEPQPTSIASKNNKQEIDLINVIKNKRMNEEGLKVRSRKESSIQTSYPWREFEDGAVESDSAISIFVSLSVTAIVIICCFAVLNLGERKNGVIK